MTAYLNRVSPIHTLDPRVKIAWSVVASLLAVILGRPALLVGLLVLTLVPWFLVRPPLARLRMLFILVAMTSVGSMVSQGFFYTFEPRTEWLKVLPGLSLSREGVFYGAVVALRLISVLAAGSLVVFTTHPSEMILALTKLRVPHWFAFMLTLSLRFLPETVEQGKAYSRCPAITWSRREGGVLGSPAVSTPRRTTTDRLDPERPTSGNGGRGPRLFG